MNAQQRLSKFGWCALPRETTQPELDKFLTDNSATYVMQTSYHHMVEKSKTPEKIDWDQVRNDLQKKKRKKQ